LHAVDSSFEQIVRDHQAMVFGTLIRLTGSREHIDDLAQEVFLRLYRALPAFRGESLLSTYLYRIVANVAQDEWKRRRREERPLVSFSEEESDWEDRLPHPGPDAERTRSNCPLAPCARTCIAAAKSFAKVSNGSRQWKGEQHGRRPDKSCSEYAVT
jgi:RNA polymerase sigma factor (sigma-70 family)